MSEKYDLSQRALSSSRAFLRAGHESWEDYAGRLYLYCRAFSMYLLAYKGASYSSKIALEYDVSALFNHGFGFVPQEDCE